MKNGRGRINKNKERRYRLQPHTALKLGLEPKEYNKYTLTIDQEKQLFGFDQEKIKRLFFDIETAPRGLENHLYKL